MNAWNTMTKMALAGAMGIVAGTVTAATVSINNTTEPMPIPAPKVLKTVKTDFNGDGVKDLVVLSKDMDPGKIIPLNKRDPKNYGKLYPNGYDDNDHHVVFKLGDGKGGYETVGVRTLITPLHESMNALGVDNPIELEPPLGSCDSYDIEAKGKEVSIKYTCVSKSSDTDSTSKEEEIYTWDAAKKAVRKTFENVAFLEKGKKTGVSKFDFVKNEVLFTDLANPSAKPDKSPLVSDGKGDKEDFLPAK